MDEQTEDLSRNHELAKKLRTADASDFQIVVLDGNYPYAASWAGCFDIALFRRRADCQRFIETFRGEKRKEDE